MIEHSPSPRALPGRTSSHTESSPVLPRFIRLRDAPSYLGMDKNRFNRDVRPLLAAIPIGTQGIAFDRLDLDSWADDYKSRNGHPAAQPEREKLWETKERRVSPNEVGSGTSISSSEERAFARALEQATSSKPKSISPGAESSFARPNSTVRASCARSGPRRRNIFRNITTRSASRTTRCS